MESLKVEITISGPGIELQTKSVEIEDHTGIGYDFLDLMWWLTKTLHEIDLEE